MSDLTDQYVDETFDGLIRAETQLPSSGQSILMDGVGNQSALSLGKSGQGITVTGALKAGKVTYPTSVTDTTLVDIIYPIGAIYLTMNINGNPTNYLGGTWVKVADGRFLAGDGTGWDGVSNQTINLAGNDSVGKYRHTLTTAEIPAHNHTGIGMAISNASGGVVTFFKKLIGYPLIDHQNSGHTTTVATNAIFGKADNELIIDNTGGNSSHNNTPPSFGVYVFQRTA